MKIVVAGASGLIGSALVAGLRRQGHEVVRLVRGGPAEAGDVKWNPGAGELDAAEIEGADAIVNLCGANVGAGRWTEARRRELWDSRIDATRTLVLALDRLARKPAVLLNASAIGIYGERGAEELTESSAIGHGFLPELCLAWETHAEGAARRGVRTASLRFGLVLAREGGALAKMLPIFRLGLGGRLGDGRQLMSWIGLDDAVGAIAHVLAETRCQGPVNVVAPGAVTNAEFTATLARVLRRPAGLPVPAGLLRLFFGQMARETVLASARVRPARLQATGYRFRHETLEAALHHAVAGR
jgi:uncharacterized protein (TIGR01777 family)